jgi:acyl carrier protein
MAMNEDGNPDRSRRDHRRGGGVPADQVTPDKSFVDDLDIDSLSMVEIAVAAQDKFGVEIPDDQLKNLKTVQDVIDYVRNTGVSA